MIKPKDIETKEFKKVAVGYSTEEVDSFLDEIYVDYERMYRENATLQKKLTAMTQEMTTAPAVSANAATATTAPAARTGNVEKSIDRILNMAEAAAAETKAAAVADAERIQKEARLRAEEAISQARSRLFDMEQELASLENRYELMRTRIKLLLYAELELLDKNEIMPGKPTEEEEMEEAEEE